MGDVKSQLFVGNNQSSKTNKCQRQAGCVLSFKSQQLFLKTNTEKKLDTFAVKVAHSVPLHGAQVLVGPLQEVLADPTLGVVGGPPLHLGHVPLLPHLQGQGAVHPGARVPAVTARLQVLSPSLL